MTISEKQARRLFEENLLHNLDFAIETFNFWDNRDLKEKELLEEIERKISKKYNSIMRIFRPPNDKDLETEIRLINKLPAKYKDDIKQIHIAALGRERRDEMLKTHYNIKHDILKADFVEKFSENLLHKYK